MTTQSTKVNPDAQILCQQMSDALDKLGPLEFTCCASRFLLSTANGKGEFIFTSPLGSVVIQPQKVTPATNYEKLVADLLMAFVQKELSDGSPARIEAFLYEFATAYQLDFDMHFSALVQLIDEFVCQNKLHLISGSHFQDSCDYIQLLPKEPTLKTQESAGHTLN